MDIVRVNYIKLTSLQHSYGPKRIIPMMPTLIMIQNKLTINARAWTYVVQDIFNFAVRSAADKADSLSTKPKF